MLSAQRGTGRYALVEKISRLGWRQPQAVATAATSQAAQAVNGDVRPPAPSLPETILTTTERTVQSAWILPRAMRPPTRTQSGQVRAQNGQGRPPNGPGRPHRRPSRQAGRSRSPCPLREARP